ncbi:flavodoxin domain-containing protein, partial [Toxoplasma gondii ARI]
VCRLRPGRPSVQTVQLCSSQAADASEATGCSGSVQ